MSVPLDQPHYGIGPAGMVRFLRKYATFRGRASRSEFWWGQLTLVLASIVLTAPGIVTYVVGIVTLATEAESSSGSSTSSDLEAETLLLGLVLILAGGVLYLGLLVPQLALAWRRLQDAGIHGAVAFAFVIGGWLASFVLGFTMLAALVPGFLSSSLKGARYEHDASPQLPPGVDAATWEAARAWARGGAVGPVEQWPGQQQGWAYQGWQPGQQPWGVQPQWPAQQQWPAQEGYGQQWPGQQQWPEQQWPGQQQWGAQQQWPPSEAWPAQDPASPQTPPQQQPPAP